MGCCVSAASNSKPHNFNKKNSSPSPSPSSSPKQNSAPCVEEEAIVKEVLTETPSSLPKPPPPPPPPTISTSAVDDDQQKKKPMQENHHQRRHEHDVVLKKPTMVLHQDDVSEDASEICSTLTESFCSATATDNKKDDDDFDHHDDDAGSIQKVSPEKLRRKMASFNRQPGKSRVARPEPFPGRVTTGGSVKDAKGHEQWKGHVGSSDMRSRSPATRFNKTGRRKGTGRCSSERRIGKSPCRVGSELGGKTRRVENCNSRDDSWPPRSSESLENPLVSLECFIFL